MSSSGSRTLGIPLKGIGLEQLILAHSLLKASTGLTREAWRLTSDAEADLILKFADRPSAQAAARQETGTSSRLELCVGATVSVRSFALTLDAASQKLPSANSRGSSARPIPDQADSSPNRRNLRIESLRAAVLAPIAVEVGIDADVWLRTAPAIGSVHLRPGSTGPIQLIRTMLGVLEGAENFAIQPVSSATSAAAADGIAVANEWFLWALGWQAAAVAAVPIDVSATFRFTRWPDFTRIPRDTSLIRLAGALAGRPLTLDELQQRADVHKPVALQALNAGRMLGILSITESPAAAPAPAPSGGRKSAGMGGFFSRLRRALHQGLMPG